MPISLPTLPRLRRFYHRVRFEWIGRAPRYQDSLEAAHAARARLDWPEAAYHFARASRVRPDSAGVKVQLGHALKESGRVKEAEEAYRSAVRSAPRSADAYIHLGHALKLQDRRPEAAEAYAKAIALAPSHMGATADMVALGARNRMPKTMYGRQAVVQSLDALSRSLAETREAIDAVRRSSTFPAEAWEAFRQTYPVLPPPLRPAVENATLVIVDARGTVPSDLRATLSGLMDMVETDWRAVVLADAGMTDHPVASLEKVDSRIRIVEYGPGSPLTLDNAGEASGILLVSAGCVPDAQALAWFRFASERSGAAIIYADHEHRLGDWRAGSIRFEPVLFGAPGALDMATTPAPPAMLYLTGIDCDDLIAILASRHSLCRRAMVMSAIRSGDRVSHVPLVLSGLIVRTRLEASDGEASAVDLVPLVAPAALQRRILVVIPTRDQPELLEACVRSLRDMASRPELLNIVVMDNRSQDVATATLLRRLSERGEIEVVVADEPFNWARFNNLPCLDRDHEILVFANNDLEMLTVGWDDHARRILADDAVGVVGARLLYEDRTIQHAGIVLGAIGGRPIHEGRCAGPSEPGPQGRWHRTREASAVTGAFMAVTAATFARVGGFDERLAIAYNDVDFCLRVREAGLSVVQAAEIEAIHHESKTRGLASDAEKVAWDDAEFGELYKTWGPAALTEAYVNPAWTFAVERSFDGLVAPTLSQILEAIDDLSPKRVQPRGVDDAS